MRFSRIIEIIRNRITFTGPHYVPRQYWKARLGREGRLYVGRKGMDEAQVERQAKRFWSELKPVFPQDVNHVLDFGCGVGRFAEVVSPLVRQYTGVDINVDALALAPGFENVTYVPLDGDHLPFPDGSFDLILAVTVLQHIVDPREFDRWTREMHRVAKAQSDVLIIDSHGTGRGACHMCSRTPETIADALNMELRLSRLIDAETKDSVWLIHGRVVK